MGSCGKTCRRACWLNFDAHPAHDESDVSLRTCSRDIHVTSFDCFVILTEAGIRAHHFARLRRPLTPRPSVQNDEKESGGEDRNRTYLATCVATAVLKTARATRRLSLSGFQKTTKAGFLARHRRAEQARDYRASQQSRGEKFEEAEQTADYFAFLTAMTISSKSGHSPDSSLEWSCLPLARISKAPPLDGISVSDLMRSPSSRILTAKLTAFGV